MRIQRPYILLALATWAEGIKMNRILLINIVIHIMIEMINQYILGNYSYQ